MRRRERLWMRPVLAGLLAAAVAAFILITQSQTQDKVDDLQQSDTAKTNAITALTDQVNRLCGTRPNCEPVDLPDVGSVEDISQDQLKLAVASYCTDNYPVCVGPQGRPGKDGRNGRNGDDGLSVTPEMVAAAVATYCDSRGECIGPAGTDGQDGATGATGPSPSDGQVLAAVAAYCDAHDGCRGPQGVDGVNGRDGQDGRGIASMECDSAPPFALTIHWTDGTTDTFTCGAIEQP